MIATHRFALVTLLAAAVAGCGSDAPEVAEEPEAAPPAQSTAPALTDPQIAHVAVTANTIDIEAARLVATRSTTSDVKSFAQTMITDHTAVNAQATALAQRLGVVPEDNPVSISLNSDAAASKAALEGLNGAAFDRAYIDREVAYHQTVLGALDQTLIPGTSNAELKALLEGVRPAIAAHLAHAQTIQTALPPR